MEARFWLDRWARNQIGFHREHYNPLLVNHWPRLDLPPGSPVFVPMCGKSLDMRWLVAEGYPIRGIELSHIAIEAFYEDAGEGFETESVGQLVRYRSPSAELLCGDYFELTAPDLADVAGVFDRGALVAMPEALRRRYADHMQRVLPVGVRMLLITLEYDQRLVSGPPFSVLPEEVERLYGERCRVECIVSESTDEVPPHFREQGVARMVETAYCLTKLD